jgi:hypothetical protein
VSSPTTWTAKLAPRETNPPEAVAPDTWWCSAVELVGAGSLAAPIVLLLPTRQPLTPGVEIHLYRQVDLEWEELAQRGVSTPDGLFVAVPISAPGVYAAGSPARFQQVPFGGAAAFTSLPAGGATSTLPATGTTPLGQQPLQGVLPGGQLSLPGDPTGGLGSGGTGTGTSPTGGGTTIISQQPGGAASALGPGAAGTGTGTTAFSQQTLGAAGAGFAAPRAASSGCGGFGGCAFGGSTQFSAACSPDASLCVTSGGGPPAFTTVCASQVGSVGAVRVCSTS